MIHPIHDPRALNSVHRCDTVLLTTMHLSLSIVDGIDHSRFSGQPPISSRPTPHGAHAPRMTSRFATLTPPPSASASTLKASSPPPPPRLLLLLPPATPDDAAAAAVVVSSPAELVKVECGKEWAGAAFHALHRRLSGIASSSAPGSSRGNATNDDATTTTNDEAEADRRAREAYEARKRKADPLFDAAPKNNSSANANANEKDVPNYYDILEIGHLGLNASDKQIKKAYQAMVLKTHPDKASATSNLSQDELNERFRLVQKAYDVLGSETTRRGYDSQFDFDDAIPSANDVSPSDDPETFFDVFGPVFESNARFSLTKPVPMLGQLSDSEAHVRAFYSFWRNFRSWRDFSSFDEFKQGDIETAETREERRWMMKQNEAAREKRRKQELTRVQTLVARAYAVDPRIAAFKQAQERAKEEEARKKEERARLEREAKALAEAEAKARAEAEAKAKAEAEAKAREEKKQAKAELKRVTKALKDFLVKAGASKTWDDGEAEGFFGSSMDFAAAAALLDKVQAASSAEPAVAYLAERRAQADAAKAEKERADVERKAEEERKRAEAAAAKASNAKKWTREALSFLAKAMAKYPGGTRNRWDVVAHYVSTTGAFPCTAEDCIAASKLTAAAAGMGNKPVWETSSSSSAVSASASAGAASAASSNVEEPPAPATQTPAASAEAPTSSSASGAATKDWTPEEQKLLEAAILKFPASMDKLERWAKIAEHVGTRSKKECAARFKELREKALAAKSKE